MGDLGNCFEFTVILKQTNTNDDFYIRDSKDIKDIAIKLIYSK